jgi:hypothetical protein
MPSSPLNPYPTASLSVNFSAPRAPESEVLGISDRIETLSEMISVDGPPVRATEGFYLSVLLVADQLARAEVGLQRTIFDYAVREYRTNYPHQRSGLFISALNVALFLDPAAEQLAVRNAGPLDVMTHKAGARRGNPSGIVATSFSDENLIPWAEGKIIFKINSQIDSALGEIVRRLPAAELLALRKALSTIIRQQHASRLFIPSIFKSARKQLQPAPTVAKQRIALLAKYPSVLSGAADPVTIVSDIVSLAESIAFSAPENMSALTRAAYHIFFQSHPTFERDVFTTLLVSAMNESTASLDFSWEPKGDNKQVAVLKDSRLCWRFNPEGCFALQLVARQSTIIEVVCSKTSALVEAAARSQTALFEKCGPGLAFIEALSRSVPFIGRLQSK